MADRDIVYDDDVSDSEVEEEDLQSFKAKMNEFSSDGESDDEDSDGSMESQEKKELTLKKAHLNAKISNLKNQLGSLQKLDDSSEEDSEDSEDNQPEPTSNKRKAEPESAEVPKTKILKEDEETERVRPELFNF